jgi:deazaflavin-dependent oxidoreductase (nitroreductase family)
MTNASGAGNGLWLRDHLVSAIAKLFDQYTRWMYRSGRPNWVARPQNRLSSLLFGAGFWPRRAASLEVTGRRSGRAISFPVVVADWDGGEYLVSMLGEQANWVKNLRAAGGDAVIRRGRRQHVVLEEVDVADRAPIIRRYAAVASGGRPHLGLGRHAALEECEAIAPKIPVFRIAPGPRQT